MAAEGSGAHRVQPHHLLAVFAGGMLGTLGRWAVGEWLVSYQSATLLVNLSGALLLGLLVGWLAGRPDAGRRQTVRLLLGTGVLGAWTSYSALVIGAWQLAGQGGSVAAMAAYLAVAVVGGLLAAWLGALLGALAQWRAAA